MNINLFIYRDYNSYNSKKTFPTGKLKPFSLDFAELQGSDLEKTFIEFLEKMKMLSSEDIKFIKKISIFQELENFIAFDNVIFLFKYFDYSVSKTDGPICQDLFNDNILIDEKIPDNFDIYVLYDPLMTALDILVF